MQVRPYLYFDGRCEEAIEFYRGALGAEVLMLMRFNDNPKPQEQGSAEGNTADKVMHATLRFGDTTIMVSDGQCVGRPDFRGFSLALTVPDADEAERLFNALADGGQVRMPPGKTFFSPRFGMLTDRFGVGWLVYVAP